MAGNLSPQRVVVTDDDVRRAHLAVMTVFVMAGIAFASWASRIPDLRDVLSLTPGRLGILLLAMSAGAVISLPTSGALAARIGSARAVTAGTLLVAAGLIGVGIGAGTTSVPLVAVGLFVAGLGTGTWDVAMNLHGAEVERRMRRTVMPWYHAGFSGGTVLAAGVGAFCDWAGVTILTHYLIAVVVFVALVIASVRHFLPESHVRRDAVDGEVKPRAIDAWTEPRTLLVGVVVLAAAFTEGAANDWLSVAITDGYRTESWVGVLGFAAFVTAMTLGRILGTSWLDRYGRVPVLWAAFALAGVGALLVILGPALGLAAAFVGALLWGVGASLGFPVGMSAAADDPRHAAARVSVVATIGYLAFLAGPPLLGFIGDHYGVLNALLVVVALVFPAMLVVPATRALPVTADDPVDEPADERDAEPSTTAHT